MGNVENSPNRSLVLFPGLGADYRMFGPQKSRFPGLVVPPWIKPVPKESLADYSARLAKTIEIEKPFYMGGASIGGMIALEVSKHLRPSCVFLIGSCRNGTGANPLLKLLAPLTKATPPGLAQVSTSLLLKLFSKIEKLDMETTELLKKMAGAIDINFIMWGLSAIPEWKFKPDSDIPIRHIHGSLDMLIPVSRVKPDHIIKNGRHLISMTHPEEVNNFLEHHMQQDQPKAGP